MKYLVVECHVAYAVVLDDEGRFLKVVNFGYEVGDYLNEVEEMQDVYVNDALPTRHPWWPKRLLLIASCIVLFIGSFHVYQAMPIGTVAVHINPSVEIEMNRKNEVRQVRGLNEDGDSLVNKYTQKHKSLTSTLNDLVDLALNEGYLKQGGTIEVDVDAKNKQWIQSTSLEIEEGITNHLENKLSCYLEVADLGRHVIEVNDDDLEIDEDEDDDEEPDDEDEEDDDTNEQDD